MKSLVLLLVACVAGKPGGWPNRRFGGDRIVGGVQTQPNEFPFQLSLEARGFVGGFAHICGASVVNELWAVTAAHCVIGYGASNLRVVGGEHSLAVMSGLEQFRQVRTVLVNSEYDDGLFDNDIALLQLVEPFDFSTGKVAPLAVVGQGQEIDAGTNATVSGWGVLTNGGQQLPDKLHKAVVPVMSDDQCRSSYGSMYYLASMLCAGFEAGGVDSCQGDSGGPLFVRQPVDTLIGIVSWGDGCAQAGSPGVYTKVSVFTDWIYNAIETLG